MTTSDRCSHCTLDVPADAATCPHCGSPLTAPNVRAARDPAETQALDARYAAAVATTAAGVRSALRAFKADVDAKSQAVLTRPATEALRLAVSERELYASFYGLVGAGVRSPSGGRWDLVREAVDSRLFSYYKEHIRFAALSLDGLGLEHYGDCFLVLKNAMIAHRSTVFEENTVVFMDRRGVGLTEDLPKGYRATWQSRAKLAVAKLAAKFTDRTAPADHPGIMLHNAAIPADDDFIEVHIYGPFSIHAVDAVHLRGSKATGVRVKALAQHLKGLGIPFTKD